MTSGDESQRTNEAQLSEDDADALISARRLSERLTLIPLDDFLEARGLAARILAARQLEGQARRDLGDGRELRAEAQIFNAYLSIGKLGDDGWDQAWYFSKYAEAVRALKEWDPVEGDPPGAWFRTLYAEDVPGLVRVSRDIRRIPISCAHGAVLGWLKYERR